MERQSSKNPQATSALRVIANRLFPPVLRTFDRGTTIFFPGDTAREIYLVSNGTITISKVYHSGEEITIALLGKNSVFGVLSLAINPYPERFYHAVALTPVELLSASIYQVEQKLLDDRELSTLMLRLLSLRILKTEMMIEALNHGNTDSRLISFLLTLCCDFGLPTAEGITIDLKLSHQAIASAIGSSRVNVTHLLRKLQQQRIISIDKKKITVHDSAFLNQELTNGCLKLIS